MTVQNCARLSGIPLVVLAVVTAYAGPVHAAACEELRAAIEQRILGNGVTDFSVVVVDSAAKVEGRVVGNCQQGEKKIIYARGSESPPTPSAATPPTDRVTGTRPPREVIITECFDGRVYKDGPCKR